MEVVLGKTAGFCFGVKRAYDGCINELANNREIYCLGELVHNKQVIYDLVEKGINFIEKLEQAPNNSKVIIRAHGVPKEIYENAKKRKIELIDLTCPKVAKVHEIAAEYSKKGYYICITCSKKTHPEILGTQSFCGKSYALIQEPENVEEAIKTVKEANANKLLLISQTTYSMKKFNIIKERIEHSIPKNITFIVENTICYATQARQDETEKLSAQVDKMIIIGGKNSSNTQKLYEIALNNCKNATCIETKEELKNENFTDINKIGVMAGASTPKNTIDKVIKFLNQEGRS